MLLYTNFKHFKLHLKATVTVFLVKKNPCTELFGFAASYPHPYYQLSTSLLHPFLYLTSLTTWKGVSRTITPPLSAQIRLPPKSFLYLELATFVFWRTKQKSKPRKNPTMNKLCNALQKLWKKVFSAFLVHMND